MTGLWPAALLAHYAAAIFVIAGVLRRPREPVAMLAWIMALLALPFVSLGLYVTFGSYRIRRKAARRRRRVAHVLRELATWTRTRAEGAHVDPHLPEDLAAIERLGRRVADMPATGGNQVEIYEDANAKFAALEEAIRGATRHVHLLYYIWNADATGTHLRDVLIEKARSGVTCRLLLDAVGCMSLGRRFTQPMVDAGVKVAFFLPLYKLRKRWTPHLRNHRKIAVVDARTAFVGSQNVGDEYRGRLKRLSPWYDSHMRVRGPAALFLQQTFAEDWLFATGEDFERDGDFDEPRQLGESIVQILPTGPEQDVSALGQLLFAAVASARRSIRIATPYFVPDPGLRMALIHAAYRGVCVQLVLPTRIDSPFVLWAARSFYRELIDAGVEVYEFDGGMLHAKVITVDDRWCMLGSANMDVRSFQLNFEITALVYDPPVAERLSRSIERHRTASRRVTLQHVRSRRIHQQLVEGAARLFAPLL